MSIYKKNIEEVFASLSKNNLLDSNYLEKILIPKLGLNNENLNEQPKELSDYFGTGLKMRIWQYPNQFSKYLILLSNYYSKIKSYLEIGSRYGGTFILHYEYLKSIGSEINNFVSIDLIESSDLIKDYINNDSKISHIQINSLSKEFIDYISKNFFDIIFIDGDHSYEGVSMDSHNTEDRCNIKVFHDTYNDACPGVSEYWNNFKKEYNKTYNFFDFTDQYESVDGNYLGIGVAVRKNWINQK